MVFALKSRPVTDSPNPVGQVTCSNCRVLMPRVSLKTLDGEDTLQEAVYHCPRCDTETRRFIAI
jgi:hypothetical protein